MSNLGHKLWVTIPTDREGAHNESVYEAMTHGAKRGVPEGAILREKLKRKDSHREMMVSGAWPAVGKFQKGCCLGQG